MKEDQIGGGSHPDVRLSINGGCISGYNRPYGSLNSGVTVFAEEASDLVFY